MKKINFCAGPSILPQLVLEQLSEAILDYQGTGLSLLEISHRSTLFDEIRYGAQALVKELLGIGDDYAVLFLTGGASMQFSQVPYNLLSSTDTAAYLDTGRWAQKAIKEAQLFGNVAIIGSSADRGYRYLPTISPLNTEQYRYLHITTNNTVCGTQLSSIPDVSCPIVADMSSDIFSKPIDGNKFGLIYAGAQKNSGTAGTTLVIVRKDLLKKVDRLIPTMLNYQTHIDKLFNTPPVFAIYASYLTLKWVKAQGLSTIAANNNKKASMLYKEIDRNSLFEGFADKAARSIMNATFVLKDPTLSSTFLSMAESAGCVALKGHVSLGGFRASMYNAMPSQAVHILIDIMQTFERKFS